MGDSDIKFFRMALAVSTTDSKVAATYVTGRKRLSVKATMDKGTVAPKESGARSGRKRRLAAAEQALRDSEAVYQSLVEALPLAVFRKDREFRLIFGNKKFCEALMKTPEEFVGRTDFDLFPRELAKKFRRDDVRVIDSSEVLEDFEEIATSDGDIREIHVLKGPIRSADGEFVGIQGMFWDVTEQHDALRAGEARIPRDVRKRQRPNLYRGPEGPIHVAQPSWRINHEVLARRNHRLQCRHANRPGRLGEGE